MRRSALLALVTLVYVTALGCRPRIEPEQPLPKRVEVVPATEPEHPELPPRWMIDGGTIAEQPALPSAHSRALRSGGFEAEAVQDHVIVDLNGDGQRDAVVLLASGDAASGFEALALLSEGEAVVLRPIAEVVAANETTPWSIYAVSVVPIVGGPTLIGAAPRPGACDQGPLWSFTRVTGTLIEPVGRVAIEPYDCAAAEGQIDFVRDARGGVEAIELRHGEVVTRQVWDAVNGSFVVADS